MKLYCTIIRLDKNHKCCSVCVQECSKVRGPWSTGLSTKTKTIGALSSVPSVFVYSSPALEKNIQSGPWLDCHDSHKNKNIIFSFCSSIYLQRHWKKIKNKTFMCWTQGLKYNLFCSLPNEVKPCWFLLFQLEICTELREVGPITQCLRCDQYYSPSLTLNVSVFVSAGGLWSLRQTEARKMKQGNLGLWSHSVSLCFRCCPRLLWVQDRLPWVTFPSTPNKDSETSWGFENQKLIWWMTLCWSFFSFLT